MAGPDATDPIDPDTLEWMLATDPALRWQVERDLVGVAPEIWQATRARIAGEGLAAELLAHRDPDGQWAGGAFFPAGFDFDGPEAQPGAGQPWTATSWSLNQLRDWGLDAAALPREAELLQANSRWEYNDAPYFDGEADVCINAATLSNGAWLGADVSALAAWFPEHQFDDGGWNCEWEEGTTVSSFHSTLNALKGLLYFERVVGDDDELRSARHRGEEYLLARHLMRRLTTGEQHDWATRITYPFRWRFNVLTATDYFRAAALHDGVAPDPRLAEAVESVRAARRPDGRWVQGPRDPGRVWFEIDVAEGEPSPWITFTALRMLRWWDASRDQV